VTTIALHKYHEQIDKLLNDSHYDLAVEHCRHILQQHPQHIATYRLLAKALLEKGDHAGATELFQRILSADPNDYIVHAGLAVIYKEEDVVSQAIWHLERAYEIEPYNAAIQHELRTLYVYQFENSRRGKQKDDTAVPNTSLPLNAGALARFYLRSQLYDQAATLLRATLEKDPERIDLRVLLMESLWRDGRRIEAVNVCLQVLDQLPNCIAANAIIAEIWLRTGRVDEAQRYLQHLQTMLLFDKRHIDRESPEGSAFHVEGAVPLPGLVEVDYLGADLEPREYQEPAGWVSGTAVAPGQTEADAGDDDLYQWLEGLTGELPSLDDTPPEARTTAESGFQLDKMAEEETAVSPTTHQSDWLIGMQIAAEEEPQQDLDFVTAGIEKQPDTEFEFADLFGEDEDAAAMDWLAASEDHSQPEPAGKPTKAQPIIDDLTPDWLADLTQDDLEPIDVDPLTAAVWLREDAGAEVEKPDDDEFDWLGSPAEPLPITDDQFAAGEIDLTQFADFGEAADEDENEDTFEWRLTDELTARDAAENLDELAGGMEEDVDFSVAALSDDAAEIPDWLIGGGEISDLYDEPKPVTDQLAAELADWVAANNPELAETDEDFDWFESDEAKQLAGATIEEPDEILFAADSTAEADDDAFRELTGTDNLPDWLASDVPAAVGSGLLDTHNLADTAVDDQTLADEDLISSDLPDWLQEEADTAVSPPIQPTDTGDLPDWLMGATLDAFDSAPLDETKVPSTAVEEPDVDFQQEMVETAVDEPGDVDEPLMSNMLRTAVALDLSSEDDFFAAESQAHEDLPDWLLPAEETGETLVTASLDVEEVVSDDKDEKITGPQGKQDLPEEPKLPPDDELDWLDDLSALSDTASPSIASLSQSDELPDWLQLDAPETIMAETPEDGLETAVADEPSEPLLPLEEDQELDWLDALAGGEPSPQPIDELPTWQWPEDQADDLLKDLPDQADIFEDEVDVFSSPAAVASEIDQPADEIVPELNDFPDDLDDAMSWLEDLAAEPNAPVEELPTAAYTMDFDNLFAAEDAAEEPGLLAPVDEPIDMPPDDPEAAMAWLEQLAARQGAPLDELPSIPTAAALPEMEVDDQDTLEMEIPELDELEEAEAIEESPEPDLFAATLIGAEMVGETAVDDDDLSLAVPDDPDEAMAWLERLAARQGAPLDELPSITDEPAEEVSWEAALDELIDGDADALPDWDEEWLQDATILVAPDDEIAALEPVDEVPDDPDEAMAWLERLAARQGAPLDELPSIERPSTIEEEADFASEMDMVLETEISAPASQDDTDDLDWDAVTDQFAAEPASGVQDELDEAMAWLADLAGDDELEAIEPAASDQPAPLPVVSPALLAELMWLEEEVSLESDALSSAAADLDEREISDDELAEALAQLDMLAVLPAAGTAAPEVLEEAVSADEDDWGVDFGALLAEAEEEDAPALEEFAAAEAVDEIITAEEVGSPDDTFLETIPDDPDEAMAWLERLAARQGAPLDELPSLADADEATLAELTAVSPDVDIVGASLETPEMPETAESDLSVPDNIDDAMAWLEQLAARQGAPLDELPTVTGEVGDLKTPDWITAEQTAGEAEFEPVAPEAEPDDLLMAAEVAAVAGVMEEETAVSDTIDEAAPDNIDDAMAWLERLAARQGVSLDELPSVDEAALEDDDLGMPDWIVAAQVAAEQEPPVVAQELETAVANDQLQAADEWDDIFQAEESADIKDFESTFAAHDEQDLDLDEVDESLPDWLTTEGEEKSVRVGGHTDWLGSLPEPDLDGWLAAEEQATIAGVPEIEPPVAHQPGGKTGPLSIKRKTGPLPELPGFEEPDFDDDLLMPDLGLGISTLELDQNRLASAREALNAGQFDQAMNEYAGLVEVGEGINTLIADLEAAAGRHQEKPLVRRMLGDAYMRNGQLQKALETYRQALDQM